MNLYDYFIVFLLFIETHSFQLDDSELSTTENPFIYTSQIDQSNKTDDILSTIYSTVASVTKDLGDRIVYDYNSDFRSEGESINCRKSLSDLEFKVRPSGRICDYEVSKNHSEICSLDITPINWDGDCQESWIEASRKLECGALSGKRRINFDGPNILLRMKSSNGLLIGRQILCYDQDTTPSVVIGNLTLPYAVKPFHQQYPEPYIPPNLRPKQPEIASNSRPSDNYLPSINNFTSVNKIDINKYPLIIPQPNNDKITTNYHPNQQNIIYPGMGYGPPDCDRNSGVVISNPNYPNIVDSECYLVVYPSSKLCAPTIFFDNYDFGRFYGANCHESRLEIGGCSFCGHLTGVSWKIPKGVFSWDGSIKMRLKGRGRFLFTIYFNTCKPFYPYPSNQRQEWRCINTPQPPRPPPSIPSCTCPCPDPCPPHCLRNPCPIYPPPINPPPRPLPPCYCPCQQPCPQHCKKNQCYPNDYFSHQNPMRHFPYPFRQNIPHEPSYNIHEPKPFNGYSYPRPTQYPPGPATPYPLQPHGLCQCSCHEPCPQHCQRVSCPSIVLPPSVIRPDQRPQINKFPPPIPIPTQLPMPYPSPYPSPTPCQVIRLPEGSINCSPMAPQFYCFRFEPPTGYCQMVLKLEQVSMKYDTSCKDEYITTGIRDSKICQPNIENMFLHLDRGGYLQTKLMPGSTMQANYQGLPCSCNVDYRQNEFILRGTPSQGTCQYTIHRSNQGICSLELTIEVLDLECNVESLVIDGKSYCGFRANEKIQVPLTEENVIIKYQRSSQPLKPGIFTIKVLQSNKCTQSFSSATGRDIKYKKNSCVVSLSGVYGNIEFPGSYEKSFQYLSCAYVFPPRSGYCYVRIDFDDVEILNNVDCERYYFQINGLKYCGNTLNRSTKVLELDEEIGSRISYAVDRNARWKFTFSLLQCKQEILARSMSTIYSTESSNYFYKRNS